MKYLKPILITVIGLIVSVIGFKSWSVLHAYTADGKTTTATLDDQYTETTRRRRGSTSKSYTVGYSYVVDGKTYRRTETIKIEPQEKMTVHYLVKSPGDARIDLSDGTFTMILGIGGLGAAIGGALWFLARRNQSRSIRVNAGDRDPGQSARA